VAVTLPLLPHKSQAQTNDVVQQGANRAERPFLFYFSLAVTAFSLFIRDLCPDARLEISFVRYEDEDAHIWIALPSTLTEEEREELANHIAEKSLDILLVEGFLILAGIEDPEPIAPLRQEAS
jgi:hypothetical protein